jgi:glycosyltransferase involved in cell wall biosynthesis
MNIVITIPAFNEERTIGRVIDEIKEVMNSTNYKYKILVVNDGSKDRTIKVAKKSGAIVHSHPRNKGLAEAFKTEIQQCLKLKADIIVHTDADGQYHPSGIPRLINKVEKGYDLVLGSRFAGRIESMPFLKRAGNIAFSKVLSKLTRTRLTDTTTGFRAFTKDVAEGIDFINSFTYTQEQIIRAAKQKFKIAEVPILARKTRESRLFKNPLDYAIKAWINILRIYRDYDPIKFFGKIGMGFFSVGFLIGLYFTYLHFFKGGIHGHLGLLFLMFILLSMGIQIILFGFLADMQRK